MAKPTANFYFQHTELLKVNFKDLSNSVTPPITAWLWNFGDGGATSSSQNPNKTYSAPGIYLVSLTVTNSDGSSIKSVYISLDETSLIVTLPIMELIRTKLPSALFDYLTLTHLIQKWQLYLQPQINPEAIGDADVFTETKWPSLANVLIADLCVYDVLMTELDKMVSSAGGLAPVSSGSSSTVNVPNQNGNIKLVEVGPSKTEWFNQQESSAMFFKAVMANTSMFVPEFQNRLCTLASRLRVTLPFCGSEKMNFLFIKSGRDSSHPLGFNMGDYYPSLKAYEQ